MKVRVRVKPELSYLQLKDELKRMGISTDSEKVAGMIYKKVLELEVKNEQWYKLEYRNYSVMKRIFEDFNEIKIEAEEI